MGFTKDFEAVELRQNGRCKIFETATSFCESHPFGLAIKKTVPDIALEMCEAAR